MLTFAAKKQKTDLVKYEIALPELQNNEVQIKVISCGICHSDLSAIDNSWGLSKYPLVAGHEVIGKVSKIGSQVKNHAIGDIVGLGWHSGYCHQCEYCQNDDHNFCSATKKTIYSQSGGFSEYVHADQVSVIKIPNGLDVLKSGPLLCAGITVFTPIVEFNISATNKIGIIGIGGLGHLALKFFKALGCEVTAFTNSTNKEKELIEMGADRIVSSVDENSLKPLANQFDFIISTVNVNLDWNLFLSLLKPRGRLHMVGAVMKPLDLNVFNLMKGRKSVSGSPVGSPKNISKMLDFANQHQIYPETEIFEFDQINSAIDKLRKNEIRYRAVMKW